MKLFFYATHYRTVGTKSINLRGLWLTWMAEFRMWKQNSPQLVWKKVFTDPNWNMSETTIYPVRISITPLIFPPIIPHLVTYLSCAILAPKAWMLVTSWIARKVIKRAHIAAHCQLTVPDECARICDLRRIIRILLVWTEHSCITTKETVSILDSTEEVYSPFGAIF